jgi:hypothetical protein
MYPWPQGVARARTTSDVSFSIDDIYIERENENFIESGL